MRSKQINELRFPARCFQKISVFNEPPSPTIKLLNFEHHSSAQGVSQWHDLNSVTHQSGTHQLTGKSTIFQKCLKGIFFKLRLPVTRHARITNQFWKLFGKTNSKAPRTF